MPENAHLSGSINQINVEFVGHEATPRLLMKLSIQLHLAGLSISNTVFILEEFGVKHARSTVHNGVHKADLQPETGRSSDQIAIDETVVRLTDERYWLYAAVDPDTNELLHTALEPTTNSVIAHAFFHELREKHDVDDAVFLIVGSHSLKDVCNRYGLDFRDEKRGNRNSVKRVFLEVKHRTYLFSNCFSHAAAETADDWVRSFAFAWNQLI
ncbi:IS6 family transposase [Halorhabdus rudnickae]|uniref:IS6 family transposase n=1 Tax=Halorhabdus rudnickae TaxID=1775544 RepID=UPI001084829D|nr:IS6 family transposase [Halorhabdus rudnickae]